MRRKTAAGESHFRIGPLNWFWGGRSGLVFRYYGKRFMQRLRDEEAKE